MNGAWWVVKGDAWLIVHLLCSICYAAFTIHHLAFTINLQLTIFYLPLNRSI